MIFNHTKPIHYKYQESTGPGTAVICLHNKNIFLCQLGQNTDDQLQPDSYSQFSWAYTTISYIHHAFKSHFKFYLTQVQ